MEAEIKPDPAI